MRDYIHKDVTRNDSDESALDVTIAAKPYILYVRNKYLFHDLKFTRMLEKALLLRLTEENSVNAAIASSYTCQSFFLERLYNLSRYTKNSCEFRMVKKILIAHI